mmetsp:Transcript_33610/g.61895  ORF Transcript_33610/g.61895 Transcript_33610/m.61895 type:complete len:215 (+) Transcript_33610:826-1470(+)
MSQNGWHPLTKDLTYVQHLPKVLTGHQPQPFHIVIDRLTYQNSIGAQQPLYNRNHLSQRLGILPQTLFRGKTCQGSKIAYHSLPLLRGTNDDVQEDVAVAIHHSHATGITMRSAVVLTSGNAFLIPANIATPVVDALGTGSVSGGDALHVDGEKKGDRSQTLAVLPFSSRRILLSSRRSWSWARRTTSGPHCPGHPSPVLLRWPCAGRRLACTG